MFKKYLYWVISIENPYRMTFRDYNGCIQHLDDGIVQTTKETAYENKCSKVI